jgi:hypothetical protein
MKFVFASLFPAPVALVLTLAAMVSESFELSNRREPANRWSLGAAAV